jgi:hypothetical protein
MCKNDIFTQDAILLHSLDRKLEVGGKETHKGKLERQLHSTELIFCVTSVSKQKFESSVSLSPADEALSLLHRAELSDVT